MRDDRERLADVLAAIERIRRHVQDDRARFDIDELLQSAVLHWIEIIGEAARGVSDKVRSLPARRWLMEALNPST